MSNASACEPENDLPPPGSRSGCGAQSVLPYLTRSLQARPANAPEPRERPRAQDAPSSFQDRPGWLA